MAYRSKYQEGYMAIEMMVTVLITATFILAFYQLFTSINYSYISSRNEAVASNLSYGYLRKYSSSNPPANWFVCDTSTNTSTNTNDLQINANAPGQTVETGTLTNIESKLPGSVSYAVRAFAVYGCSGLNTQSPIRVDSIISYGNNQTLKHSTLVGY